MSLEKVTKYARSHLSIAERLKGATLWNPGQKQSFSTMMVPQLLDTERSRQKNGLFMLSGIRMVKKSTRDALFGLA